MGNAPVIVREFGVRHVRMAAKQQLLHLDHRLPSVSPGGRHRVPREGRPRRSVPAPTSLPSCRPDPGRLRCTVDIQSDDAHAPSVPVRSKREPAGNTTSTDPPSRRIRESRKGRPCNELGLSAHCLLTAYPHLRAPGAPCPDGLTISPSPFRKQADTRRRRISYRITARSSGSTRRRSISSIASPFARRSRLGDHCAARPAWVIWSLAEGDADHKSAGLSAPGPFDPPAQARPLVGVQP